MFLALSLLPLRAETCVAPPAAAVKGSTSTGLHAQIAAGDWFLHHKQTSCAVEAFQAAVHTDPHSPVALDALARGYVVTGEYAATIELLRHAPPNEALTVDLATAYDKAGNTPVAGQTLVNAIRVHPASAQLASALVLLMANHGQLDQAYDLAGKFAHLHPHDPEAQKLYLRVLVATNDMAAARPLANKLLLASPSDGELLYLDGSLERKAGDLQAAKSHLQRSVVINPDFAESRFNLGLALQQLGDAQDAREQLQAALALGDRDPELHLALSKVLRSLGEDKSAEEQLSQYQGAIKAKSDDEMASSKASDALQALNKGDKEKAVSLYREALEVKPHDADLAYQLAMALDAAGDTGGERKVLEAAVIDDPRAALAQGQLGYVLSKSGDNDGAEEHFRLALKSKPDFTQVWINLAATLANKSQFGEARDAVDHALKLDPGNVEAGQMKRMLPPSAPAR